MSVIKLAAVFLLMILFLGLKKPLYLVMLGAAVLLAPLFALPALDFLTTVGLSLISRSTLDIVLIIWLVMLVEGVMTGKGYLERMLAAMDALFHSKRIDVVTMPMIIGFLPSAGGALFSAPMVEQAADGMGLSPERKTIINMYYRHVMEIFFPTYPAIIICSQLSGIPLSRLSLVMLPMAVLVFALGFWFMRGIAVEKKERTAEQKRLPARLGRLLLTLWPFLLMIAVISALSIPVWLACLITLILLLIIERLPLGELPRLVRRHTRLKLLLMVVTTMIFKDVLLACGAVDDLAAQIALLPTPPIVIFSLMSFFISMITGMPLSSNAIVLPLALVSLGELSPCATALIHLSAYLGAQLTPTHLCLTITVDYFHANLQKVLVQCLPVYLVIYLFSLLFYGFLFA